MPVWLTSADALSKAFAKLESHIPANSTVSLETSWRRALGDGEEIDSFQIMEELGWLAALLSRLIAQVSASQHLSQSVKISAMATIRSFEPLFKPDKFHEPSLQLRTLCNENNRGSLEIVGRALKDEFGVEQLSVSDAADIKNALIEIGRLLSVSNVDVALQTVLRKHIQTMLWWLTNPGAVSAQDLFEQIGSAFVISKQIEKADRDKGYKDPPSAGILSGILKVSKIVARYVGLADKAIEDLDQLSTTAHHLLDELG
jgi:hypothetical protein